MRAQALDELLRELPAGPRPFWYFKDCYAVRLLARLVGDGRSVREVKASSLSSLLRRPLVRDLLPFADRGRLEACMLEAAWAEPAHRYEVTLGRWGNADPKEQRWHQTSRVGSNLVIQLNFDGRHEADYFRLLRPAGRDVFNLDCHPVATAGPQTLAWARVDLDREAGEALIEEVQNDWLRRAARWRGWARRLRELGPRRARRYRKHRFDHLDLEPRCVEQYVDHVLPSHLALWDEAVLCAALELLWNEVGVRRVFYHTWEGGNRMKRLDPWGGLPPRSLYSQLPRRFGFVRTSAAPRFLAADRRARQRLSRVDGWWSLEPKGAASVRTW